MFVLIEARDCPALRGMGQVSLSLIFLKFQTFSNGISLKQFKKSMLIVLISFQSVKVGVNMNRCEI